MSEQQPNDAILAKWPWQASGPRPPPRKPISIKAKALIQAPIMAAIGYAMFHFWGHLIGPVIVWSLAGLVLVGGLFLPPLFHGFERFGQLLAKWVAGGLTWGLLVPFFYLVFGFGRLVLLLKRIDPMDRAFPDPARGSFWEPRPPVPSMEQYKKQH